MHQYLAVPTPKCNHIIITDSETLSSPSVFCTQISLPKLSFLSYSHQVLVPCIFSAFFVHRWMQQCVITVLKSAWAGQDGGEARNCCPSKTCFCTVVQGSIMTASLWSGAALSAQAHHLI